MTDYDPRRGLVEDPKDRRGFEKGKGGRMSLYSPKATMVGLLILVAGMVGFILLR